MPDDLVLFGAGWSPAGRAGLRRGWLVGEGEGVGRVGGEDGIGGREVGGLETGDPGVQGLTTTRSGGGGLGPGRLGAGRVLEGAVLHHADALGSLSTLVKSIFQQAVLANLSRVAKANAGETNIPFFILACDEYAQAITEGETGLVSDSRFFSLSREAGCLSLLALQSVATGRSRFPAAMRDRWEGILGNVTAKFFMRLNDIETAELGSSLAGKQHSFVQVLSQQQSAQGLSATDSLTMLEHHRVPPWYLTNRLAQR